MKDAINKIPILNTIAKYFYFKLIKFKFNGSAAYWEKRYSSGGNSGAGSYTIFAEFKADIINKFIATHDIETVIEFGCGDGNQLSLANYNKYLGFDVSDTAIAKCKELFNYDNKKTFCSMCDYNKEKADLALSLDVIYHLIEDSVFEKYMLTLFDASNKYVVIYSSDFDENQDKVLHVKHRCFRSFVQNKLPDWKLLQHIPNIYPYNGNNLTGSFADFFIYEKI